MCTYFYIFQHMFEHMSWPPAGGRRAPARARRRAAAAELEAAAAEPGLSG